MTHISRRDFLKLLGVASAGAMASERVLSLKASDNNSPNIIIILWDAFSAKHLSLYGYPRQTTPNVDAFAQHSTVYHNHYSGGNFTTCGTASMLTGMIPWKHRAINLGGLVKSEFVSTNPYTLLGSDYYRFAFSQNPWPDRLMGQYHQDVDRFLPPSSYTLQKETSLLRMFDNDRALASIAVEAFLLPIEGIVDEVPMGSSVLGYVHQSKKLNFNVKQNFPAYSNSKDVPTVEFSLNSYLNEEIYHGVHSEITRLASEPLPFFSYFHLYSPHYPYRPRNDFRKLFQEDGFTPVSKPAHPLAPGVDEGYLISQNALYDRQIAQVDDEFGRLIAKLEKDGVLENSYIILTSDHGELFERGFIAHGDAFLYEGVTHIPLIIRAPGQAIREDIHSLTNNIDILPTILSIAGKDPAPDVDGQILPGLGGQVNEDRPVFSMYAGENSAFGPLKRAVISMHKREYKLIAYLGYDNFDHVYELYDLANDPDELNNLISKDEKTLAAMKDELFAYLDAADRLR
jgi:arylsulfatase A-like enzyme